MKKDVYGLSKPQESIWLTEQYFKNTNINRIICFGDFSTKTDNVNFDYLKKAINAMLKSNDTFQLRFFIENGTPKQYLCDFEEIDIPIYEISSIEDFIEEDANRENVFNIIESQLYDFKLFRLKGTNTGGILASFHHIICDAITTAALMRQVSECYNSLIENGTLAKLNPDNFSYIDYLNSEKEYKSSDKFIKDKEYWEKVFETVPEVANIYNYNEQDLRNSLSCKAERAIFSLNKDLMKKLNSLFKDLKISAYNFFMAIFGIYISKVSRLDDFIIGTPILNRTNFKEKNTLGMFISTVPFRITIDNELSFSSFASTIARDSITMLRHQKYSYGYILEDLREKDSSIPNLYNVMLSYQVNKASNNSSNYTTDWLFNHCSNNDLDIHIFDFNTEDILNIAYDYNLSKFDKDDINLIHSRILNIISQILENREIPLKNIDIITPEEKNKILINYKNNLQISSYLSNIFDEIKQSSKDGLNNIAIETKDKKITYSELIDNVHKLSNYLLNSGIKSHSNIGIFTTREIDTIIAILAIINIGSTYVPLDPNYPTDRLTYMIEKSKIDCILTADSNLIDLINDDNIKFLDVSNEVYDNCSSSFTYLFDRNDNDNLYIVFTSGSTGNPKGITLSHKNMLNLINFEKNCTNLLSGNNRILQFATMSFDVSYQEIFSALLSNSSLILVSEDTRKDINKLSDYILDKKIDTLFIPPAYLRILSEDSKVRNKFKFHIKNIITAGEELIITDGIKDLINSGITLHNHYGPAETHVATTYIVNKNNIENKPPIGLPISNSYVYILDKNNNLCPKNVVGEIAISGDCVGNGYFDNTSLTDQRFVRGVFLENKMYLTGDLGYIDQNNIIHYIGRSDFQVKINGFRIELQEIDKVLMQHKSINSSVSIIKDFNNKKYIITYFSSKTDVKDQELLSYLRSKLPTYMIPTKLVALNNIPLNHNGKVDKKALPNIDLIDTTSDFIVPKTEIETIFANIWKDLFNIDKISTNYNFFELGGDSLLAIKLCARVLDVFNVNITVKDIFDAPVFSDLLKIIENFNPTPKNVIKKVEKSEFYPVSSAQKRIYYAISLANGDSYLYNMPGGVLLDKIPDVDKLKSAFSTLINRHEALRTYFEIVDGNIVQKIIDTFNFELNIIQGNYNNLNLYFKDFIKPFDLKVAPLFRAELVIFENNQSLLLFDMHHIISDGASLQILIKDLCDLYNGKTLDKIDFTYKDFSVWENENLENRSIGRK